MICPMQLKAKTRAIALVALVLGPPLASARQRRRAREQAWRCVGVCGGVGEHGSMARAGEHGRCGPPRIETAGFFPMAIQSFRNTSG